MKKQNSQLKRENKSRVQRGYKSLDDLIKEPKYKQSKSTYKTNVKQRMISLYNYYARLLDMHINNISRSRMLNHEERRSLTKTLENMKMGIKYALSSNMVDENYYNCVKDKLRDMTLFLRRLQSENYYMGKYIREYGFHPVFAPENKYIESSSLKLVEAIQSFDEYILSCLK